MNIADQIKADMKEAMKAREAEKLTVLRALYARFSTALLEKKVKDGEDAELTDKEVMDILLNESKKRKDAIKSFADAGREEMAVTEKAELEIISTYLPEQLSEEEVAKLVETMLSEGSFENMGDAMKAIMGELRGKGDTKLASELVRKHFA